jgi:hypothetical protein
MLKTPQKCDGFAALFGRPSHLGLSPNLHFDQKNAFLGQRQTRRADVCLKLVSLWSSDGRVAWWAGREALEGSGDASATGRGYGRCVFQTPPNKGSNHRVDFI